MSVSFHMWCKVFRRASWMLSLFGWNTTMSVCFPEKEMMQWQWEERIRIRDRSNVPMFLDLLSINFDVVYIHGGWLCAEVGCRGHQNVAKVATARGITTMMRQQKRKVFVQLFRQKICQPKLRRCRECLDLATPLQGREPERRALGFHWHP